ncbi:Transport protein particle subunit trs85-1 [Fonsecaea nubica]|uniref:Transport protein particle subunit trs85-1 n=1 Tax=Fonsecaea nubica TaxID=856822 RepID=A0A178CK58_9EURO|nr:Transport protein particle subunit trs85-1 [Fonsecaea nubica]OAL29714.1 Transport protein particle subunit trs85-1 [Fonsecaea nubica]
MLKRDNKGTRATLASTNDVLEKTEAVLTDTARLLEEETALHEVHELTEEKLLGIGTELVSTVGNSLKDIDGLQAKLSRRSLHHSQNREAWNSSLTGVIDVYGLVDERIGSFQAAHAEAAAASSRRIESFIAAETHCEMAHMEISAQLSREKSSQLANTTLVVETSHRRPEIRWYLFTLANGPNCAVFQITITHPRVRGGFLFFTQYMGFNRSIDRSIIQSFNQSVGQDPFHFLAFTYKTSRSTAHVMVSYPSEPPHSIHSTARKVQDARCK